MNLKKKLGVAILLSFVINIIIVFAYYELRLYEKVEKELNIMQEILDDSVNYLATNIERFQSIENIENWIKNIENHENLKIKIINSNGEEVYKYISETNSFLNITSVDLVKTKYDVYMINLVLPLKINQLKDIPLVKDILKVEVIVIGMILIFLTAILYQKIVKPIIFLQKDIENYKFGIKPSKTYRCDEIGWLKNNFVELTEKLDEEKKNQNRIIASISHDIKTPLTSILGYSERLQSKGMLQERRDRYTQIIHSKAQVIKELIDEFDEYLFNNLDNGLNEENISVKRLSNIINEEYNYELKQLNIKFNINSNCDESILNIDMSKMRRVFGNIIENSIKHLKNNEKLIIVNFEDDKDKVKISISDNGCGVDIDDIDRIFEALYTSDKSRNVAGLGLSICKSIVQAHGGIIYAKNNEMGGLTIIINLNKVSC